MRFAELVQAVAQDFDFLKPPSPEVEAQMARAIERFFARVLIPGLKGCESADDFLESLTANDPFLETPLYEMTQLAMRAKQKELEWLAKGEGLRGFVATHRGAILTVTEHLEEQPRNAVIEQLSEASPTLAPEPSPAPSPALTPSNGLRLAVSCCALLEYVAGEVVDCVFSFHGKEDADGRPLTAELVDEALGTDPALSLLLTE